MKGNDVTVATAARAWQAAGVSTIPISPNASKRPALRWTEYMGRIPELGEIEAWWGNGHEYGLALIMGRISGNCEMLELESRACDTQSLTEVANRMDEAGVGHIWDMLLGPLGYSEQSPSGGLHLIYRISGELVPGNEKVARRPATAEELAVNPADKIKVLAETRGEGGYVIVAPSSGLCHPSGESWVKIQGEYGIVPTISWEQRCLIHEALRYALDEPLLQEMSAPLVAMDVPARLPVASGASGADPRPGDAFEEQVDWGDNLLLGGAGWTLAYSHGNQRAWVRPGKDPRDGISATTGRDSGRDRLYVFTTATEFPTEEPLTKFGAYAILHHGGNHALAASSLARKGFGSRTSSAVVPLDDFVTGQVIEKEQTPCSLDEVGNAHRLRLAAGQDFRYVHQEKVYYFWDETAWTPDRQNRLVQKFIEVTDQALTSPDEAEAKWARASRSNRRVFGAVDLMKSLPGISVSRDAFDPHRHLLNLRNGVLDLDAGEFGPHRREYLMTRTLGASYNPDATCERFEQFMEEVIPDPAMRAYVQRAAGSSLLGDADQRALFLVHGPSGTGKSQFMEIMGMVFGDYGGTAPASTFKSKKESTASNDLHRLRGKRFVSTSETSESASFDEDMLKRITGRDTMVSRAIYQDFEDWTPECTVWIATNHPPRFNSDDDAVWRRAKLIPFVTRFGGPDGQPEVFDLARKVLSAEVDGIFNWLLAGLREFQKHGLGEPEAVVRAAVEQRLESDPVARFLGDRLSEGVLVMGAAGTIRSSELHSMYLEWCRQFGERGFGSRRFHMRLDNWPGIHREEGSIGLWRGLSRATGAGILGTMVPDRVYAD